MTPHLLKVTSDEPGVVRIDLVEDTAERAVVSTTRLPALSALELADSLIRVAGRCVST